MSDDPDREELTEVLTWGLSKLQEWYSNLQMDRLMTDRCAPHINAFARIAGKRGHKYTSSAILSVPCLVSFHRRFGYTGQQILNKIDCLHPSDEDIQHNLGILKTEIDTCMEKKPMRLFQELKAFRDKHDGFNELLETVAKEVCHMLVLTHFRTRTASQLERIVCCRSGCVDSMFYKHGIDISALSLRA